MVTNRTYKVGIAGYGLVGKRRHAFIDGLEDFEVVAVSDRTLKAGSINGSLSLYGDYKDLISSEDLDVLFVSLPNNCAPDATIQGLEKGLHVFCEKPPGRNVEDIRSVIEVHERTPLLKLKYGFNHRYHESVQESLALVNAGTMGRLVNMRGVYGKSVLTPGFTGKEDTDAPLLWRANRELAGGGILLDQGIHMVDLMRCYAGEFDEVSSFIQNDFWRQDVEDNAYALMRSRSGVVAMLHSSATQWRHKFSLEMSFEKGGLILSGILSSTKSYGQESLSIIWRDDQSGGNPKETTTTYIYDNSWQLEIEDFAKCIRENVPVEVGTGDDALETMKLVYKIYGADKHWRNQYNLPTIL